MKKLTTLLTAIAFLFSGALQAQVIISSNTGDDPHASTMLDIQSTNKGVSFPNVDIDDLTTAAPVTSPITGLMVYNTDPTTGPGLFWWDGSQWVQFARPISMPGNLVWWVRPTSASYIRPELNDAVRVYDDNQTYGYYYNGNNNQVAAYFRTTNANPGACAVQGFSDVAGNQTFGYLGYNGNIAFGTQPPIGGAAVHGLVNDANRTAVYGKTADNATVAAILGYSDVWIPGYFYGDDGNTSSPVHPALYGQKNVTVNKGGSGITAYFERGEVWGNAGYSIGGLFTSSSRYQDSYGVWGTSYSDFGAGGGWSGTYNYGGYFEALNYWGTVQRGYAYIGGYYNGSNRKIEGLGSMSEIIPTEKHGRITLVAPESPEYWYTDYGTIKLVNGQAHVDLDPILADIIVVDEDNPLKVFLQVNIPVCEGVAVVNKSATGFDLVERNGGTHSGEIDYQIVAKPMTNYGEGRFVQAPGPAWLKSDKEPQSAKAANQGIGDKTFNWPSDWEVYKYKPQDVIPVGSVIPAGPNRGKVKLGNGKYGNSLPADKAELK